MDETTKPQPGDVIWVKAEVREAHKDGGARVFFRIGGHPRDGEEWSFEPHQLRTEVNDKLPSTPWASPTGRRRTMSERDWEGERDIYRRARAASEAIPLEQLGEVDIHECALDAVNDYKKFYAEHRKEQLEINGPGTTRAERQVLALEAMVVQVQDIIGDPDGDPGLKTMFKALLSDLKRVLETP